MKWRRKKLVKTHLGWSFQEAQKTNLEETHHHHQQHLPTNPLTHPHNLGSLPQSHCPTVQSDKRMSSFGPSKQNHIKHTNCEAKPPLHSSYHIVRLKRGQV